MIEFMVKLQEYRTPLLNKIAEIVTITAEETFLIAVMCLVFWCLSRENGYKLILSIIFASALNSALKLLYKVDRPWVKDSRIVPLRQQTAGGYSMPSGHTQVGASLWFSLRRSYRKTWFTIIAYVMMILIAASRVYLGVQNLYTLTGYKGWDPEVNYTGTGRSTQNTNIIQGYDFYTAPQARTYSLGINLSF